MLTTSFFQNFFSSVTNHLKTVVFSSALLALFTPALSLASISGIYGSVWASTDQNHVKIDARHYIHFNGSYTSGTLATDDSLKILTTGDYSVSYGVNQNKTSRLSLVNATNNSTLSLIYIAPQASNLMTQVMHLNEGDELKLENSGNHHFTLSPWNIAAVITVQLITSFPI